MKRIKGHGWGHAMKKHNRHHQRRSGDESEENLRGRLREAEKALERERRYSRSLEKRLAQKRDVKERTEHEPKPEPILDCPNCGKGRLIEQKIYSPTKEIIWAVCNNEACKHRERRK